MVRFSNDHKMSEIIFKNMKYIVHIVILSFNKQK